MFFIFSAKEKFIFFCISWTLEQVFQERFLSHRSLSSRVQCLFHLSIRYQQINPVKVKVDRLSSLNNKFTCKWVYMLPLTPFSPYHAISCRWLFFFSRPPIQSQLKTKFITQFYEKFHADVWKKILTNDLKVFETFHSEKS